MLGRIISFALGSLLVGAGAVAIIATIDLLPPASYWCGLGLVSAMCGLMLIFDRWGER